MAEEAQAPLPVPKTIVQHDFATDMLAHPEELLITGATLRSKMEESFEVARGVYVVGSLTGDSLIRFAFGGCCVVGGAVQSSMLGMRASDGGRGGRVGVNGNGVGSMRRSDDTNDDRRTSVGGQGGDGIERSLDLTEEWQS